MSIKKTILGSGLLLLCAAFFVACNVDSLSVSLLPDDTTQAAATSLDKVSAGRLAAARAINTAAGANMLFDLRQMSAVPAGQDRSDPLGLNGHTPWPSVIGGPLLFKPDLAVPPAPTSEYDFIAVDPVNGETEYCLGLRVPDEPIYPGQFTQIEFNLRAVNPQVNGHVPGADYLLDEAIYPSNNDDATLRSLIDLTGGDVAIFFQGIDFAGNPSATNGYMNGLGPTGWVLFLRDNAFNSGRFFALPGAMKGAPRALEDTPNPLDDGMFESAQVSGDHFDGLCEPVANMDLVTFRTCNPLLGPTAPYAFIDRSGVSEADTTSGGGAGPFDPIATPDDSAGEGGCLLVIRNNAFVATGVVIDPNVAGAAPAAITAGDILLPVPNAGYNESILPAVAPGPWISDNSVGGVPGVHEIGFSVFFIHVP